MPETPASAPPLNRAERVIAFIERYCLVPEGAGVGKPIRLLDFQKKFIRAVYDDAGQVRRAYLSIARKNGKSALISCLLLAHIVGPEAVANAQIVSGALSRKQAAIIFEHAAKMIRLSPVLSKLTRIVDSGKKITGLKRNVVYEALAAEAGTAHGLSPVLAIIDEAGQIKGPHSPFVEAIETAQGAHEQPLFVVISTQAATDGDLFSTWIDDAEKEPSPETVSHVYAAPEGCALDDCEAWAAANPALGQFRSLKDMETFADQARRLPSKENSFRWLYLNQRISGVASLVSKAEWMACRGDVDPEELRHLPCWGGLDLSQSRDLTAFVLAWQCPDGAVLVRSTAWLPAKGLRERAEEERVPWPAFAKVGDLRLIEGPVIDPQVVATDILELVAGHDLQAIAYDRYRIKDLERELERLGESLPLVPHGQGFRDMSPAVDRLERLVALGAEGAPGLIHGNQPVLNLCAANAVVEADPAGNRKLTKPKSRGKIDAMVALAMALGGMNMEPPDDAPASSPWDEDPDFTLLA